MKVILDCDNTMGVRKSDVDDGLTFAYLYAHPDVEVQGITCTFANNNEHVVYYNTLQMMEDLEITDVPVLKGGRTPGAYDSEAVNFLVDTVNKNPGEITVIAILVLLDNLRFCMYNPNISNNYNNIGDWSNGMIGVSKTFGGSSILSSPAIISVESSCISRVFGIFYFCHSLQVTKQVTKKVITRTVISSSR